MRCTAAKLRRDQCPRLGFTALDGEYAVEQTGLPGQRGEGAPSDAGASCQYQGSFRQQIGHAPVPAVGSRVGRKVPSRNSVGQVDRLMKGESHAFTGNGINITCRITDQREIAGGHAASALTERSRRHHTRHDADVAEAVGKNREGKQKPIENPRVGIAVSTVPRPVRRLGRGSRRRPQHGDAHHVGGYGRHVRLGSVRPINLDEIGPRADAEVTADAEATRG